MKMRVRIEALVVAVVLSLVVVVVGSFIASFWREPIASSSSKWGEFGDYVGGVLNPLVALAALSLLAMSIRMQREELAETRLVLAAQATAAGETAKLAALSSLVEAASQEAEMHREHRLYFVQQISEQDKAFRLAQASGAAGDSPDGSYQLHDLAGDVITRLDAAQNVELMGRRIEKCLLQRAIYKEQIRDIFSEQGGHMPPGFADTHSLVEYP